MNFSDKPTMYTTMVKAIENVCWRPMRNSNLKIYPFNFTMKTGFPQYIASWLNCLLTMP